MRPPLVKRQTSSRSGGECSATWSRPLRPRNRAVPSYRPTQQGGCPFCVRQLAAGSGEQLSWLSSGIGIMFVPRGAMVQHRVENRQQLAHTGGECHLRGFPNRPQALIERLEDGIVAARASALWGLATAATARESWGTSRPTASVRDGGMADRRVGVRARPKAARAAGTRTGGGTRGSRPSASHDV
jgi:hypothetical protein